MEFEVQSGFENQRGKRTLFLAQHGHLSQMKNEYFFKGMELVSSFFAALIFRTLPKEMLKCFGGGYSPPTSARTRLRWQKALSTVACAFPEGRVPQQWAEEEQCIALCQMC